MFFSVLLYGITHQPEDSPYGGLYVAEGSQHQPLYHTAVLGKRGEAIIQEIHMELGFSPKVTPRSSLTFVKTN